MPFTYAGRSYEYHDSLYNITRLNERCVEVAVALEWLSEHERVLEVGNVLEHYGCWVERDIVDLVEQPAWYQERPVANIDIFDVMVGQDEPGYNLIVSLSTIEHIGTDFANDRDSMDAVRHLQSLLAPRGEMLLTAPTGVSKVLDDAIAAGATGATRSTTLSVRYWGEWAEDPEPTIRPYGGGYGLLWANAVWIGEFTNP